MKWPVSGKPKNDNIWLSPHRGKNKDLKADFIQDLEEVVSIETGFFFFFLPRLNNDAALQSKLEASRPKKNILFSLLVPSASALNNLLIFEPQRPVNN